MAKDDFAFFFFFNLLTCNVTYLSPIRFTLYIMITRTDTLKKCMVKHYSLGQNCQLQQYNFFKDLTPLNRFHSVLSVTWQPLIEMASLTPSYRRAVHLAFLWVEPCETSKFHSTGFYSFKEIPYLSLLSTNDNN